MRKSSTGPDLTGRPGKGPFLHRSRKIFRSTRGKSKSIRATMCCHPEQPGGADAQPGEKTSLRLRPARVTRSPLGRVAPVSSAGPADGLAGLGPAGFDAMVRCFPEGAVTVFDRDLRCVRA